MPRTTAVSAPSKAPVSLVLDEKRFSNMAKRLAEHMGERHSVKLGQVHARTALAKALNFNSPNELQALLKGTDAGKNSQLPILAGRFDEDLLGEAARDLLKATRETKQEQALAETNEGFQSVLKVMKEANLTPEGAAEVLKLLNPGVKEEIEPEGEDDQDFAQTRFVVDDRYAEKNDIPRVLLFDEASKRWSNFLDDRDGIPISEDGKPVPGFRVDLPSGYLVRWVLETLIASQAFIQWQRSTYSRSSLAPEPIFGSAVINGPFYQVQVSDLDEVMAMSCGYISPDDGKAPLPPSPEGATRLFGVAAYFVAKEGAGQLSRVDAQGKVHAVTAKQAEKMLRDYTALDHIPRSGPVRALMPFGERSLFLDVMPV